MKHRIAIPTAAPPPADYPLWVFLHGAFSTAEQARAIFGAAAHATKAVLLAPEASRPCGEGFCWSFARDATAIGALLEEVRAQHPVDAGRIALIGYSMGCTMGLWLLAQNPGTFASFAALGMGSAFEPWGHDDGGVDLAGLRRGAAATRVLLAVDRRDPGTNNDYFAANLAHLETAGFVVTTFRPSEGTHAVTDAMLARTIAHIRVSEAMRSNR
jgi:poly(3-hydroxybutyrate) depolymerase